MKYLLSFTTGSLFLQESVKVVRLYLEQPDWQQVDQQILEENLLQKKTVATQKRQIQEIKKRLRRLSREELVYLSTAELDIARYVLLLAAARTYEFIFQFIEDVVRSKHLLYDPVILEADYARFFEARAALRDELAETSPSTRGKLKQVLFRILAEGGLIASSNDWRITPPYLPERLIELILQGDPRYLKTFLLSDKDILTWKQQFADHEN